MNYNMEMTLSKIAGIALLVIGVLLILVPLWNTYQIFTGKVLPPQIFMKPITGSPASSGVAVDMQKQIQDAMAKALPIDLINNTLNLVNWIILMWILMYGGGKLADSGVKLLTGSRTEM